MVTSTYGPRHDDRRTLQRENEVLKKLSHANIVEFYRYVKTAEMLYLVMEYIEEGAFTSVLKDFHTIPERLASLYIEQVLTGLTYLHSEGVVHRDLKGYVDSCACVKYVTTDCRSNILLTRAAL